MHEAEQRIDSFCRLAATQAPRPDDIAVARMWTQISSSTQQEPHAPRRSRRRWIWAGVAASCAIGAAVLVVARGAPSSVSLPSRIAAANGGADAGAAAAVLSLAQPRTWALRAGETLTARVAPVGTITAIGPIALALERDASGRYSFHQRGGQLVVGCRVPDAAKCLRQLTVVSGGYRMRSSDAVFSVDNRNTLRITVLRGAVAASTESTGAQKVVDAEQTWQIDEPAPRQATAAELAPLRPEATRSRAADAPPNEETAAPAPVDEPAARARPDRQRRAVKRARRARRAAPRGRPPQLPAAPPVAAAPVAAAPSPADPSAPSRKSDGPAQPVAQMYQRAERNMRDGRGAAAKRWLVRIATQCPATIEACDALYDLARLEFRHGNRPAATRYLAEIKKMPISPSLRAAVRSLEARIAR